MIGKRERVKRIINKFTKSTYFILLLAGLTLSSFFFNLTAIGYILFSIVLFFILVFDLDFKIMIPLIYLWFGGYQNNTYKIPSVEFYIVLSLLLIDLAIFIYKLIKNFKLYISKIKKDYYLYSLFLIFISMTISLINTPDLGLSGLGIAHFIVIFLTYFLVKITTTPSDDSREYIVKSIIISALMISIMALYTIITKLNNGVNLFVDSGRRQLDLGWMNPNHYAAVLNIASILSVYYFTINRKSILKRLFSILSIFIFFIVNTFIGSRGGWLSYVITMPIATIVYLIYNLKIKKNNILKDLFYIVPLFVAGTILVIILFNNGILDKVFERMSNQGFDWNYRDVLFDKAIERFNLYPLIGQGVYTTNYYFKDLWNYHNYFFQMIGTLGALGLISFISYLYFSIKRSLNFKIYSIFNLIIILYFLIHGFIDTLYFHHLIMPILLVLQAVDYKKKDINLFEIQYSNI